MEEDLDLIKDTLILRKKLREKEQMLIADKTSTLEQINNINQVHSRFGKVLKALGIKRNASINHHK